MTEPDYEWWPDGCTERDVRPPDCDYCAALLDRLAEARARKRGDAPATDAGDASLAAFADGGQR